MPLNLQLAAYATNAAEASAHERGMPHPIRFMGLSCLEVQSLAAHIACELVLLPCAYAGEGTAGADPASALVFNSKNRAGLNGTLHRISAVIGDDHHIQGMTYRIGRHVEGLRSFSLMKHVIHAWDIVLWTSGGCICWRRH